MLLDNEQFLTSLTLMFYDGRAKGSVTMNIKRYDGRQRPEPKPGSSRARTHPILKPDEYTCIIHAKRKHKKISTIVRSDDVERFHEAYSKLLVSSMDALKRLKKTKTKRTVQ